MSATKFSVFGRKYKIGDIVIYDSGDVRKKLKILSVNGTYSNGHSYLYYQVLVLDAKKPQSESIIECDKLECHSILDSEYVRKVRNDKLNKIGV